MYKFEFSGKTDHLHLVEYLENSLRYGPVSFGVAEKDSRCKILLFLHLCTVLC